MTLYRENPPGAFSPWRGERIGGVSHPANIEQLWPAEELADIKLFLPEVAEPVPDGKVVTETKVRRVEGVVRFVHTLEDFIEPVPDSITMRQARLVLLGAGLLDQVEGAIDALPEPTRSAAHIEWEYAADMHRDHALIANLSAGLNLTGEQIDNLFKAAAAL